MKMEKFPSDLIIIILQESSLRTFCEARLCNRRFYELSKFVVNLKIAQKVKDPIQVLHTQITYGVPYGPLEVVDQYLLYRVFPHLRKNIWFVIDYLDPDEPIPKHRKITIYRFLKFVLISGNLELYDRIFKIYEGYIGPEYYGYLSGDPIIHEITSKIDRYAGKIRFLKYLTIYIGTLTISILAFKCLY